MMTTRELPPAEWPRLAETGLKDVWALLSPESARVVVVEEDGRIVGHCTILTWVHLEGLGVSEDHQRHGDVWRRLLHATGEIAKECGLSAMVAGSDSDAMTEYLTRLGGTVLPASFFVVPMSGFFQKETGVCLP